MTVARILKEKGRAVATARLDETLHDVIRQLAAKRIGALIVVDDAGKVAGIISERDIVRILANNPVSVLEEPTEKHMTKPVVACTESHTTHQLMEQMTTHRFRHMPVVERGKLVGIVSIGDVVKHRFAEAEMEAYSMRQYIATG